MGFILQSSLSLAIFPFCYILAVDTGRVDLKAMQEAESRVNFHITFLFLNSVLFSPLSSDWPVLVTETLADVEQEGCQLVLSFHQHQQQQQKERKENNWRICFLSGIMTFSQRICFSLNCGCFQPFLSVQAQPGLKLFWPVGSNRSIHLQLDKV